MGKNYHYIWSEYNSYKTIAIELYIYEIIWLKNLFEVSKEDYSI